MCVFMYMWDKKKKEEEGCVCRLTNITVLRLFFSFLQTLLRCVFVWSGGGGGAKWTDAAGERGWGG